MYIAYIDESGNTGQIAAGGTLSYTLGCVTLPVSRWPDAHDGVIELRRRLYERFGIPVRAELKANYLLHGGGPLRPLRLAPKERHLVYRAHMRTLSELQMSAFAIFIDKRRQDLHGTECFDLAWETLLQRLERKSHYEDVAFQIHHDDGEAQAVRKWARYARRHLTAGSMDGRPLDVATKRLVEDPIPRDSKDSYFIQIADMVAYAGFRRMIPPGKNTTGTICPEGMWDELGTARNYDVNKYSGGPPGIVKRYKR